MFDDSQIVHLDCRRPFELNYEERALLFMFCWGHPVAVCSACDQNFRQHELATDLFDHRTHLCPRCRMDLTVTIREHLFACALVPTEAPFITAAPHDYRKAFAPRLGVAYAFGKSLNTAIRSGFGM